LSYRPTLKANIDIEDVRVRQQTSFTLLVC